MTLSDKGFSKLLRCCEILYLFLLVASFYLLILSRSGEVHTIWEVLHPIFIPTLFIATALLFGILLTSEKVAYKLLLVVSYSILVHSFFSIIFPAGDLSGQQMALGRTRLVYDNVVIHGLIPRSLEEAIQSRIYAWFSGQNFQAALSVVLARILSLDIFWVHLFLVPVMWGTFTPVATYLTARTFTRNEKVAVVAGLLISAFPYVTYFGAISVPNSLGFIFFFYSFYYMVRNLNSNDSRNKFMMLIFAFFSLLSHSLTGIVAFSLILLSSTVKLYQNEKKKSPTTAKISLTISFLLTASLLPFSLIYLKFFSPTTNAIFTLDKFYELPAEEIVGLFFFGDLAYSIDYTIIFLVFIGPALALVCMVYLLYKSRKTHDAKYQTHILFFFMAFLIILVDYRILKLFMEGLPLNEERLWVFRDIIAAPFVALAIYTVFSSIKTFLKARFHPTSSFSTVKTNREPSRILSKPFTLRVLTVLLAGLLLALIVFFPLILAGWMTTSLNVAYPHYAPLQTTWYELEAVKYIETSTHEKYVVIGDVWTIYAGEVIVGVNNPRAYYYTESNKTGFDLFVNMKREPSPQWMLLAMNHTDTTVAYFIVTETRLGLEEFNSVVSRALQNKQLTVINVPGVPLEKIYVFGYKEE